MYNDFIVKVHRYWEEDNGSRGWDGWYFSKVYAIDGNEFLVYDDGGMSAYNGEEDFCETGFNWVDFTATMDRCGENGRQPIVEPLASFNIADYLADRKTEPTISKMEQVDEPQLTPNYCGTCKHREVPCGDLPCDGCHGYSNYEPKDEPQTDAVGVPMAFIDEAKFKAHCLNCQRDVADIKCLDCDGDKYFLPDEPQTERSE